MNRLSIQRHHEWQMKLAAQQDFVDPVDAELDDHLQVDPYAGDPPSRRSDKELGRLLDLLDSLGERGNG